MFKASRQKNLRLFLAGCSKVGIIGKTMHIIGCLLDPINRKSTLIRPNPGKSDQFKPDRIQKFDVDAESAAGRAAPGMAASLV
jgi:hypothetical protein